MLASASSQCFSFSPLNGDLGVHHDLGGSQGFQNICPQTGAAVTQLRASSAGLGHPTPSGCSVRTAGLAPQAWALPLPRSRPPQPQSSAWLLSGLSKFTSLLLRWLWESLGFSAGPAVGVEEALVLADSGTDTSCVMLGESLNLSVPSFPSLNEVMSHPSLGLCEE